MIESSVSYGRVGIKVSPLLQSRGAERPSGGVMEFAVDVGVPDAPDVGVSDTPVGVKAVDVLLEGLFALAAPFVTELVA